jgi:hypothetical protein
MGSGLSFGSASRRSVPSDEDGSRPPKRTRPTVSAVGSARTTHPLISEYINAWLTNDKAAERIAEDALVDAMHIRPVNPKIGFFLTQKPSFLDGTERPAVAQNDDNTTYYAYVIHYISEGKPEVEYLEEDLASNVIQAMVLRFMTNPQTRSFHLNHLADKFSSTRENALGKRWSAHVRETIVQFLRAQSTLR